MMKSDDRIKRLSTRFVAERHALMGFIYDMVRDLAAAEDIFQEVWIRLQEAGERGEPIADPAKWCRGVAKNLILHYWRDERVGKVVADRLPEKSRQLLQLKYDQGLWFAAMAGRLKRSVDGLKMALCRVRPALLECAQRKLRLAEPNV